MRFTKFFIGRSINHDPRSDAGMRRRRRQASPNLVIPIEIALPKDLGEFYLAPCYRDCLHSMQGLK